MKRDRADRRPPRLAEWLLERCVPRGRVGQSVVGDAREEFDAHLHSGSIVPPSVWYWLHILPIVAHGLFFGLSATPGVLPGALAEAARDLRHAARTLARRPGLTLAAVATLGIGMGGLTVALSVVKAVLWTPLPYPEAERLVGIYRYRTDAPEGSPSANEVARSYSVPPATYRDWKEGGRLFKAMGAFEETSYAVATSDGPVSVPAVHTTSGTFRALGVTPILGRTTTPEEDELGADRVVVLSHAFWQRMFGADAAIVGTAISLNGLPHTVIGVMPAGFSFPRDGVEAWTPLPDSRAGWPGRSGGFLQVVGRLADGATTSAAAAEMVSLQERLGELYGNERDQSVGLYPLRELEVAQSRSGVLLLLGATVLVLLIACANVANLLLVRALERDQELAVRTALGGGRLHLIAQLASEATVLAAVGGCVAILVAAVGVRPLVASLPVDLYNADAIRVPPPVLALTAIATLLVAGVTGVLPALRVLAMDLGSTLGEVGRGPMGLRRSSSQALLAVSELTLAFVLLSGAGLATQSFLAAMAAEPGFQSQGRLTVRVELPEAYRDRGEMVSRFFYELTDRLAQRGDVRTAGSASQMPYSGGVSFPPASVEVGDEVVQANVHNTVVTPGYFGAAGIHLASGRLLTADDRANTLPVVVVNKSLARAYWPGVDPLGRRVRLDLPGDSIWRTVVGVVDDVRYGFGRESFPEFYTTVDQRPLFYQTVVVEVAGDPTTVAQAMRETLWSMEPSLPVTVRSWDDLMGRSRGYVFARFGSLAMATVAGLAALLAVVGVYGVVAFAMRARRREFGVRMALGGGQLGIVQVVLLDGLRLTAAAIAAGLVAVLAGGRFLDPTLFPQGTRDPLVLGLVALLLGATGVGASVVPAVRATRVLPVEVLKE